MQTIYTANLLVVFGLQLVVALLVLFAGVSFALRWRRDSRSQADRWLGIAILGASVAVSFFLLAAMMLSYFGGTSTLLGELSTKRTVNDGDNTRFTLDFAAAQQEFVVPRRAYDLVEEGQCLEVTYYHDYLKALNPARLLRDDAFPQQTSAHVATITRANESAACR